MQFKSEKEVVRDIKGTKAINRAMKIRVDSKGRFCATGRRKSSVARVILDTSKKQSIIINQKDLKEYFQEEKYIVSIENMMNKIIKYPGLVTIRIHGGGRRGQCDAICHGIACASSAINEELRLRLKQLKLLTVDARKKERKHPGCRKARKVQQFSKR